MENNIAYRQARRRAAAKLGFYIHAAVYVLVNAILLAINLSASPGQLWFIWPLLGWGIGLASHAFGVYAGAGLMQRLIERELRRDNNKH